MALTNSRWIMAAVVGCALLATGLVPSGRPTASATVDSPEVLHLRRIQRQTFDVAQRLRSRVRADSVIARLPALDARDARMPRVIVAPSLPETHRLIAERSVERLWRRLHIDSALVPVSVVVVLDTATAPDSAPSSRRGQAAFEYVMATGDGGAAHSSRCVVVVAIHAPDMARPGGQKRLASWFKPDWFGEALLGPCAFQARFGIAGAGVDAWLHGRSYELALDPSWEEPERDSGTLRLTVVDDYAPAELWRVIRGQLSPRAQACASGDLAGCAATLESHTGRRHPPLGTLIMRTPRMGEEHWGGLTDRYLSDLVTYLGPERFGRFWRSALPPDEALRSVAGMGLDAWTHQWAVALIGEVRTGPSLGGRELLGGAMLAAICLAITAWGFGRRQVR